ncbi:hypothetical protein CRE_17547 [Caenorhabditis remanei]|uniref:DUF19 domain-containing protein n=1 Tax=Caenorhabditis remanei TaxID=31234 RepID=E3NC18_CAERE|nr:hypothetical protein CRE_17547 [Caenorhabditis remanei]
MSNCSNSMIILFVIIISVTSQNNSNLGIFAQEDLMLAKCTEPYQIYISSTLFNVSGHEILDPIFMKKFSEFTKNVSTCIGSNVVGNTARHYRFFLDALAFIGETLYRPSVFRCLQNISPKINYCFQANTHIYYENVVRINKKKTSDFKTIVDCVIEEMKIDQMCRRKETIQSIGRSMNAIILVAQQFKYFKTGRMRPMVFNPDRLR